jgi:hypothetical protein
LRDDIEKLARKKLKLFEKKQLMLEKLLLSEVDKNFYLKSGNIERITEILKKDTNLIDEINVLDFNIRKLDDSIAKKVGYPPLKIADFFSSQNDDMSRKINESKKNIEELLEKILISRKNIVSRLQHDTAMLADEITSLSATIGIKKNITNH